MECKVIYILLFARRIRFILRINTAARNFNIPIRFENNALFFFTINNYLLKSVFSNNDFAKLFRPRAMILYRNIKP